MNPNSSKVDGNIRMGSNVVNSSTLVSNTLVAYNEADRAS
jgi:hypothetical protein